jgi:transglutaminase-like putative cysteine protease
MRSMTYKLYKCRSVSISGFTTPFVLLLTVLIDCAIAAETATEYRMIVISQRAIKARLRVEAETASQPKEWFLATPQPPELDRQIDVTARLTPSGRSGRELSAQRRPILVSRVKGSSPRLDIEAEYSMTLLARSLVARREGEPVPEIAELSNAERASWLLNTPLCAHREREFQRWLDDEGLRRGADESVVDFGRRVFEYVRKEFSYEHLNELDRRVTHVCREKKSDCLGLCVVYVSIMRANDIPARILVGRWAQSAVAGDMLGDAVYTKEHVKCEFRAPGVGWIPLDPATALLQQHERAAKRHFGLDTGDFVTMHVNDQLVLQAGHAPRRTIPFLQGVYVWILSESKSNEIRLRLQWQVETVKSPTVTTP